MNKAIFHKGSASAITTDLRYKPAIHFSGVDYSIDGTTILKGVTGSFPDGKITTLAGPSGAGKTTLLKLCNGLISPTSGDIYIHGRHIHEYEPVDLRRMVGIALQNAPMVKGSVYRNLSLPLELAGKKLSEDDAASFLEDVGLDESFLHRDSKDLSGGQKQKVSIARTLVNRPRILLLDEITASLDQTSCREIEQLIVKINQRYNVTMVWITHNLDQARTIGHYTWVMIEGEVAETGESSLLESPKTDEVRRFVKGGFA
ncbi:ABC transporter ATP-binding protein [Siminovitchia fordii]|uniref:ABC transporter ATP-binding protein YjkB n=1 Tax=Siminovitchia fordii TaxID=254759 RepID=A0ABQ4K1N3_9BACI|nr:phosphate ABC transporter ATP-binding protein [Siminovitchia fordii]GIN19674.1 putative ABC transporter ATP-binding protein YjkB [Siminovitchia fordii]